MQLSVRLFKGESGERFSVLVDETGMPLYYPALFVTAELRGSSRSISTITNAQSALKVMYAWQDYYQIDLESMFKRSELLETHQIHSLRDFAQQPLRDMHSGRRKVVPIKGRQQMVSKENQHNRISVIANYAGFLARRLHPDAATKAKEIAGMVAQIKASRPHIGGKAEADRSDVRLEEEVLNRLEVFLQPGHEANPAMSPGVQYRNALMFTILRLTGLRRGELLNLKIDDFNFAENTLGVVRRADSLGDPRGRQPLAKTRGRKFPLNPELMDRIREYISKYRNKVPGATKHGYLFVTHSPGRSQGWPLSNSGFGKFIASLSKITDEFEGLHAHALRHHWNYRFSRMADAQKMTPEREQKLRSYLMGWSETSNTASTYNRRHVKEAASEAMLELQNMHLGRSSDEA